MKKVILYGNRILKIFKRSFHTNNKYMYNKVKMKEFFASWLWVEWRMMGKIEC